MMNNRGDWCGYNRGDMKIALCQINTTVGDLGGNAEKIRGAVFRAGEVGADLVMFPELAVLGYPPRDLLYKNHIVEKCEALVHELAGEFAGVDALVAIPTPRRNDHEVGTGISNSIALCLGGEVVQWYDKRLLPTYDVFDEKRYFDPGTEPGVIEHRGMRIGLTICEDLWIDDLGPTKRPRYAEDTIDDLKGLNVDLIINCSASPFRLGLPVHRRRLFHEAAERAGVPVVFTNLIGGNDDLIFDGYSGVITPGGGCVFQSPGFDEDFHVIDTNVLSTMTCALPEEEGGEGIDLEHLFRALTLGIRDYLRKCHFESVWIALSGGIDSALVAALAVAALGSEHVRGVGLPSRYSSSGSVDDARDLAGRLGIRFDLISIESAHEALALSLTPIFDESDDPPGVAEENIQARLRGNIMMALSNKFGSILLTTGNKSELAVGYCTMYGDMAGGLAVISDVPKTMVYALCNWINENAVRLGYASAPIPENTISKPPSAELRPDQKDSDSLPDYEILDEIIHRYIERSQSVSRIIAETGFASEVVERACRLIDRNEYKRRQMPTGLRVTARAFGSGWRMPIAAKIP